MEPLGRAVRFSTRLAITVLEASLEGLIEGFLKILGPEKAWILIDKDWYLIRSVFYCAYNVPLETYQDMSAEEIQTAERLRISMAKTVLPVLGWTKFIASKFPVEAVEGKVTPEWLLKRGKQRFPELVKVWEESGEKGDRWLKNQCQEIIDYVTGRTVYNPVLKGMVSIEQLRSSIREQAALQR